MKPRKENQTRPQPPAQPRKEPIVLASPIEREKLKIIPLGGLGDKIGKNMMAIEYEEDIIVVDCGFMFPGDELPGIDYVIPDITYLEKRKDRVRAMLITHGHEDHIGGLPFILPKLNVPIYAARLTVGLIESKLEEHGLASKTKMIVVDPDKRENLVFGKIKAEFFRVSHSIPDSTGIIFRTPLGTVIHTGDFKIDQKTVYEWMKTDMGYLAELGRQGVLLLMSDSTNAENPGVNVSETQIEDSMMGAFREAKGRIIVASFSSQIARTQQLFNAAKTTGRKVAISGYSMLKYVEIAVKQGLLKIPAGTVIRIDDIAKYKEHEIVILSTGAQGESIASLMRMALGSHKHVKIRKGDLVILSASIIPGNENSVFRMIDNLLREGAKVLREGARGLSTIGHVHVSGHGNQEELEEVIRVVNPKYLMPIHGELHHLTTHADIAVKAGRKEEDIIVVENGQSVEITAKGWKLGPKHPAEWILVDGLGVGDVQKVVVNERLTMAKEGIFVVIVTLSKKTGALLTSPDIISRGFVYMRESEKLINQARQEVRNMVARKKSSRDKNYAELKGKLKEDVSRLLFRLIKRKPIVIPVVIEV